MGEQFRDHTTLRLGGPARVLLTHTDPAAWPDLARSLPPGTQPFVLGGGSNVLAADAGYGGPVIRMANCGITTRQHPDGTAEVTAHAGEPLASLVARTVAEGLSGIEYLGGIPGTAGSAPVQNTGAYGQQIADTLTHLTAYDWDLGRTVRLPAAACGFGYRTSVFKTHSGRWTILTVTLRLTRSHHAAPVSYQHLADTLGLPLGARPPLEEAAAALLADREARGLALPDGGLDARQAGSVFLNPTITPAQAATVHAAGGPVHRGGDASLRASAGWLLEHVGHRPSSRIVPGVHCSTRRSLTLTAHPGATATAFTEALQLLVLQVFTTTGIRLTPELTLVG